MPLRAPYGVPKGKGEKYECLIWHCTRKPGRGGRAKKITFISSGAALRAKYGWSLYCASKAGLEQFCKTISIEQESQDNPILCITIDPDIIDTEMQSRIRTTDSVLFPESQRF